MNAYNFPCSVKILDMAIPYKLCVIICRVVEASALVRPTKAIDLAGRVLKINAISGLIS